MIKKLLDGFLFGIGFAVAYFTLSLVSSFAITPHIIDHLADSSVNSIDIDSINTASDRRHFRNKQTTEKIKESTAIVLVQFKPQDDGRLAGIITKILKTTPGVEFVFSEGDEHPASSFYPKPDKSYGSGSIVFFTGDPPMMQLSAYFYGDQIPMLNDMSLPQFLKLVKDNA